MESWGNSRTANLGQEQHQISGYELGLAEVLKNCPISTDAMTLFMMLDLPFENRIKFSSRQPFIENAILMLIDWVEMSPTEATFENFISKLRESRNVLTSEKVENFWRESQEDKELEQNKTSTPQHPIDGLERQIAQKLKENPFFANQWKNVFFLLKLPINTLSQYENKTSFLEKVVEMLYNWRERNPADATLEFIAKLLYRNKYKTTGDEIMQLLQ